ISFANSTTVVLLAVNPLLPFGASSALTVLAPHTMKIAEASSAQEILHLFITGSPCYKLGIKSRYGDSRTRGGTSQRLIAKGDTAPFKRGQWPWKGASTLIRR